MTLDDAEKLATLLCTDDDLPTNCTCCMCIKAYARRLNEVFPGFLWEAVDTEDAGFSHLVVKENRGTSS